SARKLLFGMRTRLSVLARPKLLRPRRPPPINSSPSRRHLPARFRVHPSPLSMSPARNAGGGGKGDPTRANEGDHPIAGVIQALAGGKRHLPRWSSARKTYPT